MAQVGNRATKAVSALLRSSAGLNATIAAIAQREQLELSAFEDTQIFEQNVPAEIAEKAWPVRYPALHAYCERLENTQHEKFRRFSGKAHLVLDLRVSQDRLEGLEQTLQLYVEAVTTVLEQFRGEWDAGIFYGGGYEAAFGPVKRGGKNFLQSARVAVTVDASVT